MWMQPLSWNRFVEKQNKTKKNEKENFQPGKIAPIVERENNISSHFFFY